MERRELAYDGENRPVSVAANGFATTFDYGPDGERAGKTFVGAQHFYLGADAEVLLDAANTRHPEGSISVKATTAGRLTGSSAAYEKKIDAADSTISYTKTTYGSAGKVVSIQDKIHDGR